MQIKSEKHIGYKVPKSGKYLFRIVFATAIMTLLILAILPFTQALSGDPRDKTFRSVATANIPPPEPPPPEPPPPPEEEEQEEVEDFEEPPPPLDLSSIEAALNPGTGGAMVGSALDLFNVAPDAVSEIQIFEIGDLDRRPRRISGANPPYPRDMQRQRISGTVRMILLIDESGRVTVQEILETPHPGFIDPLKKVINAWRFESPTKDGKKVRARYILPLRFGI